MSDFAYPTNFPLEYEVPELTGAAWVEPPQRSIWQPILLAFPLLVAAGGYLFDAVMLTDLAFVTLTALCVVFLMADLLRFANRFGVGGIVLFGGVLVWFCYDYFHYWFLGWVKHWDGVFAPGVIAKAGMYHMLYVLSMAIGIRLRFGQRFSRLLTKFPELPNPSSYFYVVLLTQVIGLLPYAVFTRQGFFTSIWRAIFAGRTSLGTEWTVGRTGNLNYSFGGYVAELLWVGTGGSILASYCIVFLRQNVLKNVICFFIWLLGVGFAFGGGARGSIVVLMLPAVCFIFIRYHVQAAEVLKKISIRAYVMVGILLFSTVLLFQIQAAYRTVGFHDVSLSKVSLTNLQGNAMFSSSLLGFYYIPDQQKHFYDNWPGEMEIAPIPHFILWATIAPMPRAIWRSKPVDPSWEWYNAISTGRSTLGGGATEGTTISEGIVGYWYFRFGPAGVIEGGIFMGWLMGVLERALYNNGGRSMSFLAVLAIFAWMFRTYRDADLQDLADTGVFIAGLSLCILFVRLFTGSGQQTSGT